MILVSSAKMVGFEISLIMPGKSFMYIKKNNGPRIYLIARMGVNEPPRTVYQN
jgi:hypothetical protein